LLKVWIILPYVVLRALAEGKIRWAFWPPGMSLPADHLREGLGIWLGNEVRDEEDDDYSEVESTRSVSTEDTEDDAGTTSEEEEGELEELEWEDGEQARVGGMGRFGFGALCLDDEPDDSDDSVC
jgi:hypothetical protein